MKFDSIVIAAAWRASRAALRLAEAGQEDPADGLGPERPALLLRLGRSAGERGDPRAALPAFHGQPIRITSTARWDWPISRREPRCCCSATAPRKG